MTRRGLALLAAALASASLAASARADDTQVQLPQPFVGLTPEPPLASGALVTSETRVPGSIDSLQRLRVGVDPAGRPMSVELVQELTLNGTGDYIFVVPAPATDVRPAPTTESDPGFRKGAILWQGFSPGRRQLAALVRLERKPAFGSLPLAVALDARVDGERLVRGGRATGGLRLTFRVVGRTPVEVATFGGLAVAREVAQVLDDTRAALRAKRPLPAGIVTLKGPVEKRSVRVAAAFRVKGELRFASGSIESAHVSGGTVVRRGRVTIVRFAGRVGDGGTIDLTLTGRAVGLGSPTLEFDATPDLEVRGLTPPGGGTWARALRDGRVRADGRQMLATAIAVFLRLARTNQFQTFLLNPDVSAGLTRNRASYTYVTVAAAAPTPPPADGGDGGLGPAALAAVLAASILGAGGLLVFWAHQ